MTAFGATIAIAPMPLVFALPEPVSVAPPGRELRVSWTPASGAQTADVTAGTLTVMPATPTVALGALSATSVDGGKARQITVPGGRRLRSLTLDGLRLPGGGDLVSESDLAGMRLVVSIEIGGRWTPFCSAPPSSARGLLPEQLTGARFSGRVLTLPDPQVPRLRLTLVSHDVPEEFEPQVFELGAVHGTAAVPTAELELVAPDGGVAWAFGAQLPAGAAQTVDLRAPAGLGLDAALAAGAPPDVAFRLRGAANMTAIVLVAPVRGALVRTWPGVLTAELAGEALPLELGDPPLAAETPASAVADVVIRYAGRRLHEAVRDAVPAGGGAGGPVVGEAAVVRELPPAALRDVPAAAVAPIGRAPEGCELSVEVVDIGAGPPGTPVAAPGILQLEPGTELAAHWVELPMTAPLDRPLAVALRATSGRFLWAAAGDGRPLLRLAVLDPDPGGRPLRIAGTSLRAVTEPELRLPALALPAAAFRGPAAPVLDSDLFLSLDLADLAIRYAR